MATLEITKKRIKVVDLPEEDDRDPIVRFFSGLFSKSPEGKGFAPAQTHVLSYLSTVGTASRKGRRPVFWNFLGFPIELYSKEQRYWILELQQPNGPKAIIASWNRSEIEKAYEQADAAINGPDDFTSTVHIENSNIVVGSKVDGNVQNKTNGGDGSKKDS